MTNFLETYKQLLSLSKQRSGYNYDTVFSGPIMKYEYIPGDNPDAWHEVERKLAEIQGSAISAFPNYNGKVLKGYKTPPAAWRDSLQHFNIYRPEVIIDEIEKAISLANDAAKISELEEKDKKIRQGGVFISFAPVQSFLHKVKIDVSDRSVKFTGGLIFALIVAGIIFALKQL